ncbi:MAG: DNA polymerase III subunit [Deltaproteobacteria bacterium]|nr:DNA polymerase III subunit [Deltaproteobacteria bacterium]
MWKDVIGHTSQKELLRGSINAGKVPHAFLFAGPEGLGKTKVALEFFKALNCLETPGDACDTCRSCMKAQGLTHPDLIMLSGDGGVIQVKEVRDVISDISLKPFEARKRVIIIEPAELMNKASSNAILKTLEEPPSGTVLILVSHKPVMLLPTITSRCQIIRFTPCDASVCTAESVNPVIFRLTSGSLGGLANFDEGDIVHIRDEMVNIVQGADPFDLISKYFSSTNPGKDAAEIILLVAESILRDILVLQHGGERVVSEELRSMPMNYVKWETIDDLSCSIHSIRKGINENINLRNAMSELLILFGDIVSAR